MFATIYIVCNSPLTSFCCYFLYCTNRDSVICYHLHNSFLFQYDVITLLWTPGANCSL